jgi:DNA-binding NarL/FixJ family response regulator
MRRALALRSLTADETRELKLGARSTKGMTVRRSQILLASARGYSPTQIASVLGCNASTVTYVISDFHAAGSSASVRSAGNRGRVA